MFNGHEIVGFYSTLINNIAALRFLKENLLKNFGLIAVFVKVAFEITKRAQHCVNMPMRAASRSRAKTIVTSFSRDLYSDRPKITS